ncbi:hypothetical protein H8K52_02105 [Undibacterium seohonense]|jgi:hypothetical protein|uniref:Uncharacterized protein n=1 Tax=Undibacterium seohonense TaxID=1344950 RepID=A0ABR6WZT2_9BURK|nr:hypothetical protein [Undibacterium seohonense]MBC3806136.1 hypothetical protein [Undibacterium seohonense]
MKTKYAAFLRTAFSRHLSKLDAGDIEPKLDYLPYDFDGKIAERKWHVFGAMMVVDELREITNIINHWHGLLLRWHAWNKVIADYNEEDAWELRREFLEPLAHHCLLSPSAARDTLTFVATNSIHQLRLALGGGYKDHMDGDSAPGKKPKYLTRARKEERLKNLVSPWIEGGALLLAIEAIDDNTYREATSDYRNRSSHAIGPRLALGHTQAVTRSVVPATKLKKQPDGTYKDELIPGKMSICYGVGGTPPLDMEQARKDNLVQYHRARHGYVIYRNLLFAEINKLPKAV